MNNPTTDDTELQDFLPVTAAVMTAAQPERSELPTIPYQPPAWAQPDPEHCLGEVLIVLQRARDFATFFRHWASGEAVETVNGREYTDTEVFRAADLIWAELRNLGSLILSFIDHPLFQKLSHSCFLPDYVAFGSRGPENEVNEIERGGVATVGDDWVPWTPSERKVALAVLNDLKQRDVLYRALRDTVLELQESLESICM